jgi:hypothetical protein
MFPPLPSADEVSGVGEDLKEEVDRIAEAILTRKKEGNCSARSCTTVKITPQTVSRLF